MKSVSSLLVSLALCLACVYAAPQAETTIPSAPTLPPTPTTTRPPPDATIGPIRPTDTCSCPGPILCCSEIVDSLSDKGKKVLDQLGAAIEGAHVPVGVGCWRHHVCQPGEFCTTVICSNPVCCFESSNPGIGAVGCVKVPGIGPQPTLY